MKNKTFEHASQANNSRSRLMLRNPATASDGRELHDPVIDKSSRPAVLQLRHVEVPPQLVRRAWKLRFGKTLRRVHAQQQTAVRRAIPEGKASLIADRAGAMPLAAPVAGPRRSARTMKVAFATVVIWCAVVVLGIFAWRTRSPKAEPSFDSVRIQAARSGSPSK